MSDELFLSGRNVFGEFLSSCEFAIFRAAFLRIKKAQEKLPDFARDEFHAVSLIDAEVGVVAKALNDAQNDTEKSREHIERAKDALLDVITVTVRLYLMLEKREVDNA